MKIGSIELPVGAGLAPMAGVTDVNMRVLCAEMGCAWSVSEMLSAKGYLYSPDSRVHRELLSRDPREGISALQLFGSEEDILSEAVKRLNDTEFSFFDFNMGCPAHKIVTNGEGSALMRKPVKAGKVLSAMVRAARTPVTVKIRAGWDADHINAAEIARIAEESGVSAVTVHPRTREMFYTGNADWAIIAQVKSAVRVPVIGNGDIRSGKDALKMLSETGCDAVCAARAAQGNPWLFREIKCALTGETYVPPDVHETVALLLRHLEMHIASIGEKAGVMEMRKHIAWYLQGLPGSGKLRAGVNTMKSADEVRGALISYEQNFERR